jgi:hypothetical protein
MPKHKVHNYSDKLLFSKNFAKIHRAIDRPYVFLGRKHRSVFHTFEEAYYLGCIVGGGHTAGAAGMFHVWLDQECSKDKNFKKWLELSADLDRKLTREIAKRRKKYKGKH